ncbi:MAG: 50S ribosomal protein L6, partial [Bartonella sp.]|nr:50S ribosomal protein L6 [Bartonella sp.]
MSRIGKKPILVPSGVTAIIDGQLVKVKGPKGELSYVVNDEVLVKLEENVVLVEPRDQ